MGWVRLRALCVALVPSYLGGRKAENPTFYSSLLHVGRKELEELLCWVWDLEGQGLMEEPVIDRVAKLCQAVPLSGPPYRAWVPPWGPHICYASN